MIQILTQEQATQLAELGTGKKVQSIYPFSCLVSDSVPLDLTAPDYGFAIVGDLSYLLEPSVSAQITIYFQSKRPEQSISEVLTYSNINPAAFPIGTTLQGIIRGVSFSNGTGLSNAVITGWLVKFTW